MLKECKVKRIPKQITTVTIEGRSKGGRPRKRRRDEAEDDLNIKGTYMITR